MRWLRAGRLPSDARAGLRLEPGERVIAHARTGDGEYVVATDRALHLPGGEHLGWESIDHAAWKDGRLHVRQLMDPDGDARELHLRLADPHSLPQAVRERVTATIAINRYFRLFGERGVRIVGRRRPGSEAVAWTFAFDPGLDPDDPELRAMAEQALGDLRRQTGT